MYWSRRGSRACEFSFLFYDGCAEGQEKGQAIQPPIQPPLREYFRTYELSSTGFRPGVRGMAVSRETPAMLPLDCCFAVAGWGNPKKRLESVGDEVVVGRVWRPPVETTPPVKTSLRML
jgi:hypothetical protein